MRGNLLTDIKTAIITNITSTDRKIYFYGSANPAVILCSILFDDLINLSTIGDIASYLFSSSNGVTLRDTVVESGIVKTFNIWGRVNISDPINTSFITGTVGGLTSSADMRFNKINWQIGQNITITNLYLTMK